MKPIKVKDSLVKRKGNSVFVHNDVYDLWMRRLSCAEYKVLMCFVHKGEFENPYGLEMLYISGLSIREIKQSIDNLIRLGLLEKVGA